jgi:hypothetical protein
MTPSSAPARSRWSDFVDLLRESVITQALITVLSLSVTFALVALGRAVPDEVWAIDGLVVGFYFGGKVQSQALRLMQNARRALREDE